MSNRTLLSGNEALALGAYDAGLIVAAAYPGTPSTEIMEHLARFKDIYTEWSTNEQVAVEVATGASYAGVRSLAAMKHVGLNVAGDAFMAAATTGVEGGLVIISADDPGIHSSQNEQDNRHYAMLAKVPVLEPSNSQEAYELMTHAFDISERFDTPTLMRVTTRISHSKSVVEPTGRTVSSDRKPELIYNPEKYVMLPTSARLRRPAIEERLIKLANYAENFPLNQIIPGDRRIGIISSGIAYQYAREVFPEASFLKLAFTYPLPQKLIKDFADKVDKLLVIEELDPFLEQNIRAMGIEVIGKEIIPRVGELSVDTIYEAAELGNFNINRPTQPAVTSFNLPKRPPLLCAGCPHSGAFFVLSSMGQRASLPDKKGDKPAKPPRLIFTGDIGCYTLAAYPPLSAIDTCGCMGASIGHAIGLEKAGVKEKIVAIIGDSTFMHAGTTGLIDAIYNDCKFTVIILDNQTTAMTGHQGHPGTGVSASGHKAKQVDLESLVRGIGIKEVVTADSFDLKNLRSVIKKAVDSHHLSVVIVRGECPTLTRRRSQPMTVENDKCNQCDVCLMLGCPAIQKKDGQIFIETSLCVGKECGLCLQICPKKAISAPAGEAA